MFDDSDRIVAVVRYQGAFRWYRSEKEIWILDLRKRRAEFIAAGISLPASNPAERFGIPIVDCATRDSFLLHLAAHEIPGEMLRAELLSRLGDATLWWDVADLFPTVFVDFDACTLAAMYGDGLPFERYAPPGWEAGFSDFLNGSAPQVFPASEKFWIVGGSDLLKLVCERGNE